MSKVDPTHLYRNLVSPDKLLETWELEAHRSTVRGRDGLSPQQFFQIAPAEALRTSQRLLSGNWNFIAYKQILKSRGALREPRVISVPSARDRAPLKSLSRFIRETVSDSRGKPSQDKVREVADCIRLGRFRHFVRIDVRNFYPSIGHTALFSALDRYVEVEPARKILRAAVTTPTLGMQAKSRGAVNVCGVPQGLSVSNVLAEMVLSEVDRMFGGEDGIRYFRYIDDIFVLTERQMHRKIYRQISSALMARGLRTHDLERDDSKSTWGQLSSPVDFLGYSLSTSRVSVRDETVNRLKSRIAMSILAHGRDVASRPKGVSSSVWEGECNSRLEWYLNISISGCVLDGQRRGWVHYFSLIDDFSLLRRLDHFVRGRLKTAGLYRKISAKYFISSYRKAVSLKRDKSGYVADFDRYTSEERQRTLKLIFRYSDSQLTSMSETEIDYHFFRELRSELDSLETDLSLVY